jgi:hypothetical protein
VLSALKGVIKHAGKSVSAAIRSRGCDLLKDLLQADADDVRSCAAKVIGTLSLVIIIFIFLHLIHNTSLFTCPFMMCHRG